MTLLSLCCNGYHNSIGEHCTLLLLLNPNQSGRHALWYPHTLCVIFDLHKSHGHKSLYIQFALAYQKGQIQSRFVDYFIVSIELLVEVRHHHCLAQMA